MASPKRCMSTEKDAVAGDELSMKLISAGEKAEAVDASDGSALGALEEPPPVPEGKFRLTPDMIDFILSVEKMPIPGPEGDLDTPPNPLLPPELVEERKRNAINTHKVYDEFYDDFAHYQAWVRHQLSSKGYVDVDHDFDVGAAQVSAAYRDVFGDEDEGPLLSDSDTSDEEGEDDQGLMASIEGVDQISI